MKILAIKLRAIGDTVIWTSALADLRKAYPQAEIHVLTYGSNAAVFEHQPLVDQTHFLETKSRWELIKKLWKLRAEKFDWLLAFHANTSLCRWAWLAGAQKMALHHHSWRKTPRGSVLIPEPGKLEDAISRDHQVLRAMGIQGSNAPTSLVISREEQEWAESTLQAEIRTQGGDSARQRFMFLPGAAQQLRRYPKDLWWGEVLKLRDRKEFQPVVLADDALAEEWNLEADCLKMRIPLVRGGSLRAFMALISRGENSLANDSGPGHISVALGLKTAFVFGPGCVGDWHCYDSKQYPIYRVANLDCRLQGPRNQEQFQYCTVDTCSHHRCMRENRLNL
jgi:ADP-heptose:LPS heptosyltransferase